MTGSQFPLHEAVRRGDCLEVATLLDRGADLHAEDDERNTPLAVAISTDDGPMVSLLLERGAAPRRLGGRGGNPLARAVAFFATDALRALVQGGHRFEREEIAEALAHPTAWGRPAMITSLLDAGYDLSADPPPLRMVDFLIELEGPEVLRLLLERGLDADRTRPGGEPMLIAATRHEVRGEVLPVLLDHARQVDVTDPFGRTALMWCAVHGHRAGTDRLLAAGTHPARQDALGRTAAEWAASGGHASIVEVLVARMDADWPSRAGFGEWERRLTGLDRLPSGGLALFQIRGTVLEWIAEVPEWSGDARVLLPTGVPMRRGRSGPFLLLRRELDNRLPDGFLPPALVLAPQDGLTVRKGDRLLLRQGYARLDNLREDDPDQLRLLPRLAIEGVATDADEARRWLGQARRSLTFILVESVFTEDGQIWCGPEEVRLWRPARPGAGPTAGWD